jgi:hypothetical protein
MTTSQPETATKPSSKAAPATTGRKPEIEIVGRFRPDLLTRPEDSPETTVAKSRNPAVADRLGQNALDFSRNAPPELVAARHELGDMIDRCNNDPDALPIWIDKRVDRWLGQAMWERVRGEDLVNRTLTDGQIENPLSDILAGTWQPNGMNIKFTPNGQVIDGQGRIAALLLACRQKPDAYIITDVRFRVPPEAFSTMDTGKNRTAADILSINGISNGYVIGAMARLWNAYHTEKMFSIPKVSHSRIQDIVLHNKDIFVEASRIANTLTHDLDVPRAISGFVFALGLRADKAMDGQKTSEFVHRISSQLHVSEHDPSLMLVRTTRRLRGVKKDRANRTAVTAMMIKALNAHFLGQDVKLLRYVDGEEFPKFVGDKIVARRMKSAVDGQGSLDSLLKA